MTPGTKVRLSGRYLASTGQRTGGEGQKVFTVIECVCPRCRTEDAFGCVAVDERNAFYDQPGFYSDEEKRTHPELRHRHIARVNLQPQDAQGRWVRRARFEP